MDTRNLLCLAMMSAAACSAPSPAGHDGAGGAGGGAITPRVAATTAPAAAPIVGRLRSLRYARATPRDASPGGDDAPREVLPLAADVAIDRVDARLVVRAPALAEGRGARAAAVTFDTDAKGGFHLADPASGVAIDVAARPDGGDDRGDAAPAEVAGGYVVLRGAGPGGADVVHRPSEIGTEDYVALYRAPARERIAYDVALGDRVAGLRLVGGTIEVLDAAGAPRLRVAPPSVVDASGRAHPARLAVEGCAVDTSPRPPWGRAVTPPGARRCTVELRWSSVTYPAVVDPAWTTTGSLATPRMGHVGVEVSPGRVLVVGGLDKNEIELGSAELFDAATGTWAATGALSSTRRDHAGTLLATGKALVSGGSSQANAGLQVATTEIYDQAAGTFAPSGAMTTVRSMHATVLLPDGEVLAVGGSTVLAAKSSELFDPDTGTWTASGALPAPLKQQFTATALANGDVLVAGGGPSVSTARYTYATGTWAPAGNLTVSRNYHSATRLADGRVLVVGGWTGLQNAATAELFDPATGAWTVTGSMTIGRYWHAAARLGDRVLVTGGANISSAEVYDPASGAFRLASSLVAQRQRHTATPLSSSEAVLVAGGSNTMSYPAATEVFAVVPKAGKCSFGGDCETGFCSDGLCCDAACDGWCDVCKASLGAPQDGTCGVAPAGYAGNPSCGAYACNGVAATCPVSCATDSDCTGQKYCGAAGTCVSVKQYAAACDPVADCKVPGCHVCATGHCVDGYCCNAACDGPCDVCSVALGSPANGQCAKKAGFAGSPSCAPYVCGASSAACPVACATDAECQATSYCAKDGTCQPRKALGEACDLAGGADCKAAGCRACTSGFCANGVCCDTACGAPCDVCSVALGASADGTCSDAPAGYLGDPTCAVYACDGTSSACGTACTSDDGCAASRYCGPAGTCLLRKFGGAACDTAAGADCFGAGCRVCSSSHCVDGRCCDTACDGPCNVCSIALGASSNGICSTAAGFAGSPSCAPYVCAAGDAACPSACASDARCDAASYCAADGTCQPRKATGAACDPGLGADCKVGGCHVCASGHCVDGVCCDAACDKACDACSAALGAPADGTCGPAAKGLAGAPSCAPYVCGSNGVACPSSCAADADCVATHYCASDATCKPKKAKGALCNAVAGGDCLESGCAVCQTGACSDGLCCDAACDGPCDVCKASLGAVADGTCTNAPKGSAGSPACGAGVCSGTSPTCPGACATDADCAPSAWCRAGDGTCLADQGDGGACTSGAQCSSGHCVDGVCCDQACKGLCQACTKALKGFGSDGVCGDAAAGIDPHDDCPDDGASSCQRDGACDGGGSCRKHAQGTGCGDGQCVGGAAKARVCDGLGSCALEANGVDCAPYGCAAGACRTACAGDADCSPGNFCDGVVCRAEASLGAACASDAACASGFCADGVCCDRPCDGPCEACDGAKPGTCAPVSGAPHAGHAACAGAGTACAGSCDGVDTACSYPGATTSCGSSCDGGEETPRVCDGQGACKGAAAVACAPYVCDGASRCKKACEQNADCVAGFACSPDGACTPAAAVCVDDRTLRTTDGETTDCAPYRCGGTACKQACTSVDDCVAPNVCDTQTCVPPSQALAGNQGAAACAASGGAAGSPWGAALAAMAAAAVAARRAARRGRATA